MKGAYREEEAVAMIDPRNLDTLHPQFDQKALRQLLLLERDLAHLPELLQ